MTPSFRRKFKQHSQSCFYENVYIIMIQSRVNRHVCDGINFINKGILSNILVM